MACLAGKEFTPKYAPARLGKQQRSVIDATLFRNTVQWQPHYTLKNGLQETIKFFRGV
jgi:dTDP-D-glucose 4,6-dehydratase